MTQISKVAPRPAGDKDKAVKQRLYVGGLVPNVTAIELGQRFESFGVVESVDIIHKQGSCQGTQRLHYVSVFSLLILLLLLLLL